jgi:cytoskeletal protein RodZ
MVRIGQRLHDERIRKGLTLADVEKATRIKATFLTAIERGDYRKLPSTAYAHGFVTNYAEYLGFSKREALALFRREFDEEQVFKVLPEGLTQRKELPMRRIRIQHTVIIVGLLLFILTGYILFQYRYALLNPPLAIHSPSDGAVVSEEIIVAGRTDPNATVVINNDTVSVAPNGEFRKSFTAFTGKTTITVKSKNRLGKETTVTRVVNVK